MIFLILLVSIGYSLFGRTQVSFPVHAIADCLRETTDKRHSGGEEGVTMEEIANQMGSGPLERHHITHSFFLTVMGDVGGGIRCKGNG